MIDITTTPADNIIIAKAHGKVTGEDYGKIFVPAIESKIKSHGKIRLLYSLGHDFQGYTMEAIWDDAKLGLAHLSAFEKVAIVTNVHWIIDGIKFFRIFFPCKVKVFYDNELAEAGTWIATD
jgi:hypothetical protein